MKADTDVRFQKCSKVFCSHFLEKTKQGEDPHKTHIVGVRWVQKEQLRLSVSCAPRSGSSSWRSEQYTSIAVINRVLRIHERQDVNYL